MAVEAQDLKFFNRRLGEIRRTRAQLALIFGEDLLDNCLLNNDIFEALRAHYNCQRSP